MADIDTLAASVEKLIGAYGLTHDEFATLVTGPADGGPAGDGMYPVTTPGGDIVMVPSFRRQASGAVEAGVYTAAIGTSFPATVNRIQTTGRLNCGDGGSAIYVRWALPMAALDGSQQNVSWFQTPDGARWVLEGNQLFRDVMFGAMGGAGIDARPIINGALAAPMLKVLYLSALDHYLSIPPSAIDGVIMPPSGKSLRGVGPAYSRLFIIPVAPGTRNRPVQALQFTDDIGGSAEGLTIDCQRSGLANGAVANNDRVSGVTVRAKLTDGRDTRVERVDVVNATGYAHYDSADYGGATQRKLRGIVRRNCRAINSQVGFESTGDVHVKKFDCLSVGYTDATPDGGAVINTEAHFHYYGPIGRVELVRCGMTGKAAAGLLAIVVDAYPFGTLIATDCDFDVPNAVPACVVTGAVINGVTYRIGRFESINSRWASGQAGATSLAYCTTIFRGGRLIGGYNAANGLGGGAGADVSTGAIVDFFAPEVIGNANPSGTAAAFGLNNQAGSVRWHGGGTITAVGPAGLMIPVSGSVTYAGQPLLTPAAGSSLNPVAKADYPNSFVMARLVADPTTDRYISTTEILTRDGNNRWFLGDAQASGSAFATTPGKVNILGSGRNFLVASTNGNNYVEIGGQGSGTAYNRAYEGNYQIGNAFAGNLHLATGAVNRWTVQSAGHFVPASDNTYSLGTASLRASVIFAATSTINTSDERLKLWRGAMRDVERAAARAIVDELGFYQWIDAVEEKGGDQARYHFGARAQRVWSIMAEHGLVDPIGDDGRPGRTPYAFLCYDEWPDEYEDVREQPYGPPEKDSSMPYVKTGERLTLAAGSRYGLREGQMTLFLLGSIMGASA